MGSYIASLNDFAVRAIPFVASTVKQDTALNISANNSANLAASQTAVCVPSGGTAYAKSTDYTFELTTDSSVPNASVNSVKATYVGPKAYNKALATETFIFNAAALAPLGSNGQNPISGTVTVTLVAGNLDFPVSTKYWNNECVAVYVGGSAGNIVGTLASDDSETTIAVAANSGVLPVAFKSLNSTTTTAGSLVLLQ